MYNCTLYKNTEEIEVVEFESYQTNCCFIHLRSADDAIKMETISIRCNNHYWTNCCPVPFVPFSATNECLGYWTFGRVTCDVWLVVDVLCCTASIWNLCIIAADRYTATVHPVWYRDRSSARRRALAYIGLVWAVSIAVCLPPLFGWNNEENFRTTLDKSTGLTYNECAPFRTPSYVLYSALGSFFVPFLLTVALYVLVRGLCATCCRPTTNPQRIDTVEYGPYWKRTVVPFIHGLRRIQ